MTNVGVQDTRPRGKAMAGPELDAYLSQFGREVCVCAHNSVGRACKQGHDQQHWAPVTLTAPFLVPLLQLAQDPEIAQRRKSLFMGPIRVPVTPKVCVERACFWV